MSRAGLIEVILNPAASGGSGARLRPRVEAWLTRKKLPFTLSVTDGPSHAYALARAACANGAGRILVVGGDGTVHEVANGLLAPGSSSSPPPSLAVVPVGTGNDFYRMVGASRTLEHALTALEQEDPRWFDVGLARFSEREVFFVNLLGVGVDVEVLRRRETFSRLRGLPQYLAALLTALVGFRPESFRFVLDGGAEVVEGRTLLSAVTVGPSVGGGFLLSPGAAPDDALLDFFFAPTLGLWKVIRYIPKVIRGTHGELRDLHRRRFARGRLERSDGTLFHFEMDGERMPDPVGYVEIEVIPGRLPVLLPRRDP